MKGRRAPDEPRQYAASVECGRYVREVSLPNLSEPAVTRSAFLVLTDLVDDPAVDVDQLGPYLVVTVAATDQMWIYPVDVFLQNLVGRRGDQSRARRALRRLGSDAPSPEERE